MVPPAVVVRSAYAGRDPVPFAAVQVFGPQGDKQEFQTGRTDRRGVFSFVPDAAGGWRVVVDDEEGHRREVRIEVPERFVATVPVQASRAPVSRWERAAVGLALMFGATGVLYGLKARKAA